MYGVCTDHTDNLCQLERGMQTPATEKEKDLKIVQLYREKYDQTSSLLINQNAEHVRRLFRIS